jgi:8-amino-7-oxononanoate synthase
MKQELKNLKEKNLYRSLKGSDAVDPVVILRDKKKFISFCCNDYLGLSHDLRVKKAAIAAINKYGVGARASRYVTGNNSLYFKLEEEIAKFKNSQDAIVFSSGYSCAIGVIPALVGEGDLIIADRLIHSSLIDAAKLSGARFMRFLHNDIASAQRLLEENRSKFKKCLIITETIFSMDGDLGDVEGLLKLAKKFNCLLISDDAHGLGLKSYKPVANHIQIGTLSKAFGALGGYVAADQVVIEYLRNFAKSQIYSTALPPAILAAALVAVKIIAKGDLGKKALANAQYFSKLMNLPKPQSAIVVIIIGDNKKVLDIAKKIEEKGFLVSAIRPPTVETGKARLRITFSAMHKKKQIEDLSRHLNVLPRAC